MPNIYLIILTIILIFKILYLIKYKKNFFLLIYYKYLII